MSYNVQVLPRFEKNLKKLVKKYPSLKSEYIQLIDNLKETPDLGTPLGHHCYKIRISISSKGKGKSGGGRVITHFVLSNSTIYLLSIYDKSEKDSLTDQELKELLKQIRP